MDESEHLAVHWHVFLQLLQAALPLCLVPVAVGYVVHFRGSVDEEEEDGGFGVLRLWLEEWVEYLEAGNWADECMIADVGDLTCYQ
jgi:hypothetical protein